MKVKICGVTQPHQAAAIAECGAWAVGINFWPRSPRCVDRTAGLRIAEAVAGRAELVGVFVDADQQTIDDHVRTFGLDRVQLHGDEPPELVERYEFEPKAPVLFDVLATAS